MVRRSGLRILICLFAGTGSLGASTVFSAPRTPDYPNINLTATLAATREPGAAGLILGALVLLAACGLRLLGGKPGAESHSSSQMWDGNSASLDPSARQIVPDSGIVKNASN